MNYVQENYKFLIEYARFINYRYLQDPTTCTSAGLKEMLECLPRKVKDADDFFEICVSSMNISEKDLLENRVSPQNLGYTSWMQMYAMTDDVYSNYVRMIPCVYVSDCGMWKDL